MIRSVGQWSAATALDDRLPGRLRPALGGLSAPPEVESHPVEIRRAGKRPYLAGCSRMGLIRVEGDSDLAPSREIAREITRLTTQVRTDVSHTAKTFKRTGSAIYRHDSRSRTHQKQKPHRMSAIPRKIAVSYHWKVSQAQSQPIANEHAEGWHCLWPGRTPWGRSPRPPRLGARCGPRGGHRHGPQPGHRSEVSNMI